jgi:hypothetical protein
LKTVGRGRSIGVVSSEEFWLWLSRTSDLVQVGTAVAGGVSATLYVWKRRRTLARVAVAGLNSVEDRGRRSWMLGCNETKLLFDAWSSSDMTVLKLRDDALPPQIQTSQHPRPRQQRYKKNPFSGFGLDFRLSFAD